MGASFRYVKTCSHTLTLLVFLSIHAPNFGFLELLHRENQFLCFGRVHKIHDTDVI